MEKFVPNMEMLWLILWELKTIPRDFDASADESLKSGKSFVVVFDEEGVCFRQGDKGANQSCVVKHGFIRSFGANIAIRVEEALVRCDGGNNVKMCEVGTVGQRVDQRLSCVCSIRLNVGPG